MPSPHARTVANLTSFIVNAPADAARFTLTVRGVMDGSDDLIDVDAAKMLQDQEPEEFAQHCVLQAQHWADGGGGSDTVFLARYVDAAAHALVTHRFRIEGGGAERFSFDGSGESMLRMILEQNQLLLEYSLKSQKVVGDHYEMLITSMGQRVRDLERRLGVAELDKDKLLEIVRDHSEEDGEDLEKIANAVAIVVRQLKEGEAPGAGG